MKRRTPTWIACPPPHVQRRRPRGGNLNCLCRRGVQRVAARSEPVSAVWRRLVSVPSRVVLRQRRATHHFSAPRRPAATTPGNAQATSIHTVSPACVPGPFVKRNSFFAIGGRDDRRCDPRDAIGHHLMMRSSPRGAGLRRKSRRSRQPVTWRFRRGGSFGRKTVRRVIGTAGFEPATS